MVLIESSKNLLWRSEDENLWRQPAYIPRYFKSAGECDVMLRGAITSGLANTQGVGAGCIRGVSQLLGPRVSTAKARHFAPRIRDRRCAYDCFSISPTPPSRVSATQPDKSIRENPASEYLLGTWPIVSIACPSSQPEHNHVIHRYLTRRHTSWAGQRGRALCNSSSTFLALLDTSRLEENPP